MDLSFPRFESESEVTTLPADLAALIVNVMARQADSETAHVQARFVAVPPDPRLFAPLDGAFNGPMAAMITGWKDE